MLIAHIFFVFIFFTFHLLIFSKTLLFPYLFSAPSSALTNRIVQTPDKTTENVRIFRTKSKGLYAITLSVIIPDALFHSIEVSKHTILIFVGVSSSLPLSPSCFPFIDTLQSWKKI